MTSNPETKMARRRWTNDELNWIYDRTHGRCHLCRKQLAFINYARHRERGSWEIEHSRARARGGTDHLRNVYPACIPCNRSKGTRSSRSVRAVYGFTSAPLSHAKKEATRKKRAVIGLAGGVVAGAAIAGPPGAIVGAFIGALGGATMNPED